MKNRYVHRSRISEKKIREIIRYFATDLTALQSAQLSGLNRNTINRFHRALRERKRDKTNLGKSQIESDYRR